MLLKQRIIWTIRVVLLIGFEYRELVGERFQNICLIDLFTKQLCFKKHWNFTKICRQKF